MLFFRAASLRGGILQGLPLAHGWVIDSHVVDAMLLFGLRAIGAGRILGLDACSEDTALVEKNPWLRLVLA